MKHIRFTTTLFCLTALAASAGAQGLGITDIMRGAADRRIVTPPPAAPQSRPASRPAPPPEVQRSSEYIVALVDSEPVTNTEVQMRMARVLRENPEAQRLPRPEFARLVLERIINERAMLHLAKESGIKIDELAVDQAEQSVAQQNQISVEELRRRVAADGLSQEQFRRELREQIMLARLRGSEVEAKIKISDAEVDQFIREQRAAGSKSSLGDAAVTQTQARHILLRTDAKRTTAQAVAQLQDFRDQIQKGTDFASLARDNSEDGSARNGGDLGWTRSGQFVPEFEEAMDRLTPGQVSDPVISRYGVHLIQVLGRREAKLTQIEQREAAREVLREKKIEQNTEAWVQEVRARAYVEYREPPQS
jgi:peptidyl-prolyl cis-trans isomerase SurA